MATFSLTIPNSHTGLVIAAYNSAYNYQPTIPYTGFNPELPVDPVTNPITTGNPESDYEHLQRQVKQWMMDTTKSYEIKTSGNSARQDVIDNFDLDIT